MKKESKKDINKKETIKKLYQNPKYRALFQLGFYFIFFIFVFIFLNINREASHYYRENDGPDIWAKLNNNYRYNHSIQIKEDAKITSFVLTGQVYNHKNLGYKKTNVDEQQYYIENKDLYLFNTKDQAWIKVMANYLIDEDIYQQLINIKTIGSIVTDRTVEYKTEYKDGTIKEGYRLDQEELLALFTTLGLNKISKLTMTNDAYMTVDLYFQENEIKKIEVSLNHLLWDINEYLTIHLNYDNINEIEEFNIEID